MMLIEHIALTVDAYHRCLRHVDLAPDQLVWRVAAQRHSDTLGMFAKQLPAGSGLGGTTIDTSKSRADRVILQTSYHHMNDGGMYDGWTDHRVTVRPSFIGRLDLTISGRDRNGIKEYLCQVYHEALTAEYQP